MKILVVDDDSSIRNVVATVLRENGHHVVEAENAEKALILFSQDEFPFVITDIRMGGMNGIELLEQLKQQNPDVCVVIMTSHSSKEYAIKALKAGAYDYLEKPFEDLEVISNIASRVIEKFSLIDERSQLIDILKNKNAELENLADKLYVQSVRDTLTGLYNRRYFYNTASLMLSSAQRTRTGLACAMIDIDHFKKVNDTHGHHAGDYALQKISSTLSSCFKRDSDLVARMGGEEFAVLFISDDPQQALERFEDARQIIENKTLKFNPDTQFKVTISIGLCTQVSSDLDETMRDADELLYQAKSNGRNQICSDIS
jgi:diguanylate cyclase (GGDEF)-like protein